MTQRIAAAPRPLRCGTYDAYLTGCDCRSCTDAFLRRRAALRTPHGSHWGTSAGRRVTPNDRNEYQREYRRRRKSL